MSNKIFKGSINNQPIRYFTKEELNKNFIKAVSDAITDPVAGYKMGELIGAGADINCMGENGETALLLAVRANHTDLVKLLVNSGADVNQNIVWQDNGLTADVANTPEDNDRPYTALMIANYLGHKEIAEYLKANGAK